MFQTIDLEQINEYERLRKGNFVGFAHVYLERCNKESKTGDKIDVEVYARLFELDTKLGTRTSEQLFLCLFLTTRLDIIKVRFYTKGLNIAMILDYRLERSPRI